jgi:hypothetical protein
MKKPLLIFLSIVGGIVVLGIALFFLAFAGNAKTQDAPGDSPDASTEQGPQEARELLGEPAAREPDPVPQQPDNAGQFDTSIPMTRSETVVTEERSTSVSIGTPDDGDRQTFPPGQPSSGWGPAPATGPGYGGASPAAMFAGRWRLATADGSESCNITLKPDRWQSGYRANIPAGCPKDFFDVSRWDIEGNQLRLSSSFGKVIASFSQAAPTRFNGVRTSDGARVILTR